MNSGDHNLNNPMSIDLITLQKMVESWQYPDIRLISQEEYDLIQTKDPLTHYIIQETTGNPYKRPKIYLGDHLLPPECTHVRYVMGMNPHGEYEIYLDTISNGYDKLVPIRRYPTALQAVKDLQFYNNVGSHSDCAIRSYRILVSYIHRDISL
ncbi:MAG: hypothetical protein NC489_31460, partial [Ruminococcus flavefaciens]|nr:hypothetical protein [Ruminococcus flavefaciens]